jgi:hypothetical protein
MAFGDFTFPDVQHSLGLTLAESDLFGDIEAAALADDFLKRMRGGVNLALAINTEKARSEFIIAPILLEVRRLLDDRYALFSGSVFDVDASRGLNGFCDFILSKSPLQSVLTAPVIAITEAKNDNLRSGLGQCIAAMVAASEFNRQAGSPVAAVHGVVTTGAAWKFLRLTESHLTLDIREYFVDQFGHIVGILRHILVTS